MDNYHYLLQHELLNTVKVAGDKDALIINNEHISYRRLYTDCLALCDYFKSMGLLHDDRILIRSGNTYLTIISFWAVLFYEAVPCVIDENFTTDLLSEITQNISPKLIISADFACFKDKNFIESEKITKSFSFRKTESDLAMIMHTSGSTGIPKGVMLSHRNVLAALYSIRSYLNLKSSDIILSVLPMHFDYGLYQMLLSMSVGATLLLEKNALFPNRLANLIPRHRVTVLPCVPSLVHLFHVYNEAYPHDFSSVRLVTNTGENLSLSHIQKIKKIFPSAAIFSMYGLTECKRCSYVPHDMLDSKAASIGIAMPNLEMWVQDSEGNRLPANCEGDLVISGPTVMMGYWNNKEATDLKISVNAIGKRILLSGDKAIMDEEGYFYFKGREDSIIKYKGAKLILNDYVNKISNMASVFRCFIVFDCNRLLVCIEVNEEGHALDQLRLSILKVFPENQKPDHIFSLKQFPSLSNGKLDKNKLKEMVNDRFNFQFAV